MHRFILFTLLLLAYPLLAADQKPAKIDLEAATKAVLEADAAFGEAARGHDRDALRAAILGDAIFLGEQVNRGRVAFVGAWAPLFDPEKDVHIEWEPMTAEVAVSGEVAYSLGRVKVSFPRLGSDEIVERPGHYLSVWRKDVDDEWRIWASGTLVIHPDPALGIARERRRALAQVWNWPALAALDADVRLEWLPERVIEADSGELAVSFGHYEVAARLASGADSATAEGPSEVAGRGAFVSVWLRDDAGYWALAAESFSSPI